MTLQGKPLKLVVIGGGSTYTPELVGGIMERAAEMPVAELWLVDVEAGQEKLAVVGGLVRRMLAKANLPVRVELTLDRRRALEGADFVINQFRVGGLAARAKDESIPMAHGIIGQETTGPGGFAKALRTIPVALAIAREVEQLAPDAWVMNFTNPAGLVTEALTRHSRVKAIGLCNVPISMQRMAAQVMQIDPARLRFDFIGLNHLSWVRRVTLDGQNITQRMLEAAVHSAEIVKNIPGKGWAIDFLLALGMLPSPYLRYFYFPEQMLAEEQEAVAAGRGTRAVQVQRIEEQLLALYRDPHLAAKPALLAERGGAFYSEAALGVMSAIVNNRPEVHVVNAPNCGTVPELPSTAVVETNCLIDGTGATPLAGGRMPLTVRGLVQQVKAYEELTIQAALTGDRQTAVMALAANPLVPSVPVAARLVADLLEAHAEYLPQFGR